MPASERLCVDGDRIEVLSPDERAASIRLLVLDVDGVLTDGSIVYDYKGRQIQTFHVHDGLGIKLLQKAGIEVAIISARRSDALARRAEELGIEHLFQGAGKKADVFDRLLGRLGLESWQAAFVGDDWVDLPVMTRCGLAVAVSNARQEVKAHAHYVTSAPGGCGAVREVCELILAATGVLEACLKDFAG